MSHAAAILHEVAALRGYLAAVKDLLNDGTMAEMTGFEKRVADICLKIQNADKEIQTQALPELTALLNELNVCEQSMRAWHEAQTKAGNSDDNP